MSSPILATKLYVPPPRPKAIRRARLVERLDEGLHSKLTLISAPAGFGKTTLASEWIANGKRAAAWLSLDESDNDPSQFLTYLVAALQTIDTRMGAGLLNLLQSPQPLREPSGRELFLTSLINEVAKTPQEFILVLDDYHVIGAQAVDNALTFLLDHLPPQMHLVIATREDPHLPLARLRARGQLTELRAADLRFTPTEAGGFLNQVMGLELSAEEIAALETRTEGWIAGLQMAALALQGPLSMQGGADTATFIRAFTGSHRFVLDYLVEEVLQGQPERVRSFLLQTAILDRLSGPLCDAVTRQEDGSGMLEALERGNLFVVPLDEQSQWYRYHHLFADVLQARLLKEQPDQVSILHQRASEWCEQNDLPSGAIRHALAAGDFERAAGLIERAWPALRRSRQEATMLGWVKALPDKLFRARPVLTVVCAWALLDGGELEAAEARLRDAERWLDTTETMREQPHPSQGRAPGRRSRSAPEMDVMVVVDETQFRALPASIANARAYRAQALGDTPGVVTYARQALDLLAEDDHYERGTTAALLGLAYWAEGDLEAAHWSFADGLASLHMGGGILILIGGTFVLADIRKAQGRLREAVRTYEQSLRLATAQGPEARPEGSRLRARLWAPPVLQGTAELYLGLSELYRERGDLEAAREHLRRGEALGEQASLPGYKHLWCVAHARLKEAQADVDGALDLLHKAEGLYYRSPIPDVRPIAALKARVWIAAGRLAEALGWVRERGLSVDDELSYLREYEHITLARVLIARYQHEGAERAMHEAVGLLERLLQAAVAGERMGSVIEILVLQALAHQAQGDLPTALAPLARALTLAEPEGYVRIFVDEGPPMAVLLEVTVKQGIAPTYARQLLAAFVKTEDRTPAKQDLLAPRAFAIEPLSERELDVLRLLRTELSGPEIARELMVSLNTMRTHTKSIYNKLGVNNRRAAVRRAEELDLL
jgi:LuxR family maltose regulon positive regulatory protein